MKELKILMRYSTNSFQQVLTNPSIFFLFFISKVLRYGMFAFLLYSLFGGLSSVGGYSREQMVLFYLVYMLIDTMSQILFREVYRFRQLVSSGGFDMVLVKPFHPLLRVLLGGPDLIDLALLVPIIAVTVYITSRFIHPDPTQVLSFLIMVANSLVLATAFHVFVVSIGVLTLSVDHLVMIYRDITALVRIPVDLFTNPLRAILIFVVPVGIMYTFPAKVLFGLLDTQYLILAMGIGVVSLWLSLKFWNYALKHYQSASS